MSHSQSPSGILNLSGRPNAGVLLGNDGAAVEVATGGTVVAVSDAPGLGVVQATHFVSSALFCTRHVSHSHEPSGVLNLSPNPPVPVEMSSGIGETVLTAEKAEGRVREDLSPVPGFAVSQATHFTASGLFCTKHVSQSQVPMGLENKGPNPVEGDEAAPAESRPVEGGAHALLSEDFEVESLGSGLNGDGPNEEEMVEVEGTEGSKVVSGDDALVGTGEVKPGSFRRSSTLPCFKVLAGLNGPSNSSVLLFVTGFTDADIAVLEFPLDTEGANFATGALKVNPVVGGKEGGLAAVALTIGEENVNGALGGVDATAGFLFITLSVSLTGVTVGVFWAGAGAVVAGGGTGENVIVGSEEMGSEMAGRFGASGTSSSS